MNPLDALIGPTFVLVDGTPVATHRNRINLIAGTGVSLAPADNVGEERTDVTVTSATASGGMSTTLYVDKNGDNGTAARGSIGLRYSTIAAALAAAQSGDTIHIGPGTWTETLTDPDVAVLTYEGEGWTTQITSAAAATIARNTNSICTTRFFRNLAVINTNVAGNGIYFDGSSYAGGYFAGGILSLENVYGLAQSGCPALSVLCSSDVSVDASCSLSMLQVKEVVAATIGAARVNKVYARWDTGATVPTGNKGTLTLRGTRMTTSLELAGVVQADADGACYATLVTAALLTNAGSGDTGSLTYAGRCGNVTVTGPAENKTIANLSGAHFEDLTVSSTSGAGRLIVHAHGAYSDGIIAGGADVDFEFDGSDIPEPTMTAGGAVNRSFVRRGAIGLINGALSFAIKPPFVDANYTALVCPRSSGTDWRVTAKTPSAVEITSSAVDAGAELVIYHRALPPA